MEVSTKALAKIISATRQAILVDETLRALGTARHGESVPEKVAGDLMDVLFELSGEILKPEQDFIRDSRTVKLVTNCSVSEEQTAIILEKLSEQNVSAKPPKLYTKAELLKFLKDNGGYAVDYGYFAPKGENVDDIG